MVVYSAHEVKKAVVIMRGLHSHPSWPKEKVDHAARADILLCVNSMGVHGVTGGKVNNCTLLLTP